MDTDHDKKVWENYAGTDAYFSVLTQRRYRRELLDDGAKAEFFETGIEDVDKVWDALEEHFGIELQPKRALDYGCGVARILLPLAARCESVVGVDLAEGMLREARRNLDANGAHNYELQTVDEFSAAVSDSYDFVHSYIVLQHIEPAIGYEVISTIVKRLENGGYGMLHVTYQETSRPTKLKELEKWAKTLPPVRSIRKALGREKKKVMLMSMHAYWLPRVNDILDAAGCKERLMIQTDHGVLGQMIFFRKGE